MVWLTTWVTIVARRANFIIILIDVFNILIKEDILHNFVHLNQIFNYFLYSISG